MLGSKLIKFPMSILKRQVSSSSNFSSFFLVMTHNSSVNFKLIMFLLWIKESHQSPHFDTSKCFGKNLPYSSFHFPNRKSVFLQILHHSSVSWRITPRYFFRSNIKYFAQQKPMKVNIFETFECSDQNQQISVSFSSKFASIFRVTRRNFSVHF